MAKIAINGFGRIGRLFFRQAFDVPGIEIVAINDLGDMENMAYLLRHDSVYRDFNADITAKDGHLIVNGKTITCIQEKDPTKLPWASMGIDLVVECTGLFESFEKASVHLKSGAKRVVISAPAKDGEGTLGGKTILMGINDSALSTCEITSNGSCTTNATSPIVAVIEEHLGIIKGALTTVHAYTGTQSIIDYPAKGKDYRRGRAAAQNIVPSSTGAAIAVTRAFESLTGKFDGIAVRVPVITGSLIDFTFLAKRKTTKEEVNELFKKASEEARWKGILGISTDQPVSGDIIGTPFATVVDLEYTKVIDGDLVKVLSWYDNEWGYVRTLIQHVLKACEKF
jgi:glyceraldehyde 3-phosphate dehydrogenase